MTHLALSRRDLFMASAAAAASLTLPELAEAAPIDTGSWSPVHDLGFIPIHLHLLPNGKLLLLQDDNAPYPQRGPGHVVAYVVDLPAGGAPGARVRFDNTQINLFCSGHAFLPDGRLLFTGGHIAQNVGASGTTIFDYRDNSWETNVSLPVAYARWYGSAITLGSGEILTVSGYLDGASNRPNPLPQTWTSTTTFRDLTAASRKMDNYPSLFTAPDGRVFRAGPEQQSLWLSNISGTGKWTTGPTRKFGRRKYGPCAMYDAGLILALGGGLTSGDPTNTAEIINLNASSPTWQFTGSMQFARRHGNAIVLPDGTVLAVGGTSRGSNVAAGRVLIPELWNPATGRWTALAPMKTPRLYHSTAMLLPDARVIAGGGGRGSSGLAYPNCEIFSPPYLFKGPRPVIDAPGTIGYGSTFTAATSDPLGIASVCLIRLGSVTHTFNMNQRRVPLAFTRGTGSLSVSVPTNRSNLPPGHYMLFAVNTAGVPSVAPIIRVA